MRPRLVLCSLFSFLAGVGAAICAPTIFDAAVGRFIFPHQRKEIARVTSPDGTVDAVSVESNCGVPCSLEYHLSIVPKGAPAPGKAEDEVLYAENAVNPRVKWKDRRLLEFGYDKARIEYFRNIAYPFLHSEDKAAADYMVEIRLAPSSPTFSYLDRNGAIAWK